MDVHSLNMDFLFGQQGIFEKLRILPSRKRAVKILHDVNGIIKPSRFGFLDLESLY